MSARVRARWAIGGRRAAWLALVALAGCNCGEEAAPRVDGPTPYLRCHEAEPTGPEVRTVGDLTLRREGRRLTVEGLSETYRVAVGSGAPAEPPPEGVALVILIDGPADEVDTDRPVLSVAGPSARGVSADSPPRIIDATVLRAVRAGPVEWVPVAGAPDGRYAEAEEPCGLSEDDTEAWDLGEASVPRVVLAWAGPSEDPATRGLLAQEAGSSVIRGVMRETGAEGAIFAWPTTSLARGATEPAWGLVTAVAPLSGGSVVRADGARITPGWTVLSVGGDGLAREVDAP